VDTQRLVVGINGDWSPALTHPLAQGQITFLLELNSSKITRLNYALGFGHRADEKLLEVRDFRQGLSHINRAGWNSPISAALAYAEAAEELMGLKPPARAVALRDLVLELHILQGRVRFISAVLESLNLLEAASRFRSAHENLASWSERLTGGRLHDAFVRLGGVGCDIPNATLQELQTELPGWRFEDLLDSELLKTMHPSLVALLANISTKQLSKFLAKAMSESGSFDVQLPKVVKVPRGQSFKQKAAAFGTYGVWLHSDGGKSPQRLRLTPPSIASLTQLKSNAVGLDLESFKTLLIHSPISIGELER
jgi:NADH:ubiquinone oxidoreductase subunit D